MMSSMIWARSSAGRVSRVSGAALGVVGAMVVVGANMLFVLCYGLECCTVTIMRASVASTVLRRGELLRSRKNCIAL